MTFTPRFTSTRSLPDLGTFVIAAVDVAKFARSAVRAAHTVVTNPDTYAVAASLGYQAVREPVRGVRSAYQLVCDPSVLTQRTSFQYDSTLRLDNGGSQW
ncbi:hypothetical protein HYV86_01995 [Candidatus Woesearchaeota archaeon]|nr:hypothetical protein [Candidatus Woesearchaeota archaeon]